MKKYISLVLILLATLIVSAQTELKTGLKVGPTSTPNRANISKITNESGTAEIYSGATRLLNLDAKFTAKLDDADTVAKVATKYDLTQSEISQEAVNQAIYDQMAYLLELINSQTTPLSGIYVSRVLGNDTTGNGNYLTPYRSITKAHSMAQPNDVIRLLAGNYYINTQIDWNKAGVDLIGESKDLVTVHCRVTDNYAISAYSATVISGDHIFSGITFNGDALTGFAAIQMAKISNVVINNCSFIDLSEEAVYFGNTLPPVTWATNNKIYSCTFNNCSAYDVDGSPGVIGLRGQSNTLVYNNRIDMPVRGATPAGFGIKTSYTKGLKIYDNIISIPANDDNLQWAFAMELWNTSDECDIYNNTFNGPVDFAGDFTHKGSGAYSVRMHNNFFGHSALQSVARVGLLLECEADDLSDFYVYDNEFKNLQSCISIYTLSVSTFSNIYIYRNTFTGIGISSNTYWGEVLGTGGNAGFTIDKLYLWNNTLISGRPSNSLIGMVLPTQGTVTNVYIQNNIVKDFGTTAVTSSATATGTISNLWCQNNVIYNCGGSNEPVWGGITPTAITKDHIIKLDPLVTSSTDFHLQTGSPCINAGINVGLPYLGTLPDIGAFEKQ